MISNSFPKQDCSSFPAFILPKGKSLKLCLKDGARLILSVESEGGSNSREVFLTGLWRLSALQVAQVFGLLYFK